MTSGTASAQFAEEIDPLVRREDRASGGRSLRITERIDYDFGGTEHHGIFRDVPTRLRYNDSSDRTTHWPSNP